MFYVFTNPYFQLKYWKTLCTDKKVHINYIEDMSYLYSHTYYDIIDSLYPCVYQKENKYKPSNYIQSLIPRVISYCGSFGLHQIFQLC